MNDFKIGDRVVVESKADEHCDHDILWGVGKIVRFFDHDRAYVKFDNGSGGYFPLSDVRAEG